MTRKILILCILLNSVFSYAAGPCASTFFKKQGRNQNGLRNAERLWLHILRQKDSAGLKCMLADNFRDTTWRGQVHDRAQALSALKERAHFEQRVTIENIEAFGNTGVVWGVNTIIDPVSRQTLMRIRFTDVFRYKDSHWIAIAAQETAEKEGSKP